MHFIRLLLIIFAGGIVYTNSLNNQFVWDDEMLIVNNHDIRDFHWTGKVFTTSLFHEKDERVSYRPLQTLTYILDYSIWELNPAGYHLTNLLLHIITACLAYALIMCIFGNIHAALLTSIFFVLHPIQTEAVTYISGRADLLAAIFILSSLLLCVKIKEFKGWKAILLFSLLAITSFLGLLSRESALILPLLVILLYQSCNAVGATPTGCSHRCTILLQLMVLVCTSLAYLFLRYSVLGFIIPASDAPDMLTRLLAFIQVLPKYIVLLLYPQSLHMERHPSLSHSLLEPYAVLALLFFIIYIICLMWAYKRSREIFFGLSWIFISLIPHSGIVPVNAFMAEHWLYLPSLGFFFLLSMILARVGIKKISVIIITTSLILVYGCVTILRNRDWKDPLTFYTATLKFSPYSARVHHNLGNVWRDRGDYVKAVEEYEKAIRIRPEYPHLWNNMGVCWFNMGEHDKAKECYKRALAGDPELVHAYYNMGLVYEEEGLIEKAILWYRRALNIEPRMAEAHCNLGNIYYIKGLLNEAESEYKNAIIANPFLSQAHYNLGILYEDKGLLLKSAEEYDRISERDTEYYSKALSRMKKLQEKILDKSL